MGIVNLIIVVLLVLWLGGLFLHVAGALINVLLVAAIVVWVLRFTRRSTV